MSGDRLCFNHERALFYFAIRAFTNFPQLNIDLISRLLWDRDLLESKLSYELGTLIKTAFIYLNSHIQHTVMATIQTVLEEAETDGEARPWIRSVERRKKSHKNAYYR